MIQVDCCDRCGARLRHGACEVCLPLKTEPAAIAPPTGVELAGDRLVWKRSPLGALGILAFVAVWEGLAPGFHPIHLLFSAAFAGSAVFALFTRSIELGARGHTLWRRHPWLAWWRPLSLDTRNIARLVVVDTSYSTRKGVTVRFDVQAELRNGGLQPVVEAMQSHADATYVCDALTWMIDAPRR